MRAKRATKKRAALLALTLAALASAASASRTDVDGKPLRAARVEPARTDASQFALDLEKNLALDLALPELAPASLEERLRLEDWGSKPHVRAFGLELEKQPQGSQRFELEIASGEWETGLVYMRNRWYDPAMGRFVTADPLGYVDGPSMYQFAHNSPELRTDPSGLLVILIHGVNTDAGWYKRAISGLARFEEGAGLEHQEVIEFTWGDPDVRGKRKQGGLPNYATDSVSDIYSSTPNRRYMVDTVLRLSELLKAIDDVRMAAGSTEAVNVISHSQGSVLTIGALQLGASLDNLIIQGSPLDVLPLQHRNDLSIVRPGIRGKTFNYWSRGDEWAAFKGGIGANGDLLAQNAGLSWVVNREFGPSLIVNGFGLPFTGEFSEFDHSDYMAREEFFEKIHALDLDHSGDRELSRDSAHIQEWRRLASW